MLKTKNLLGAGAALSLVLQTVAFPALAEAPANKTEHTTTFQYRGPAILHIPGAKTPTGRPEWLDMRDPNVASAVFATHGASGVQEIVDASLGECSDITELDTLINDLDNATKVHEADTKKIRKDQPLHQTWQGVLTVADGATQVVPGISVGGPLGTGYAIGGGIRTVKQLGNENWQGRLDRNYLSGARLQVKGMQVFLASERIYHRHMKVYCPVLSGYVKKFGAQISFTPVATTVTTPQPGPTAPSPSDWNQP